MFGDLENFVIYNPSETPHHIQPEWYFLFAYGILRSVPNKLGGFIGLLASVSVLFFLPRIRARNKRGFTFSKKSKFRF